MKQPKISIYKNPRSGKFRWQVSSTEEFNTSEAATDDLDKLLHRPKNKHWIWDAFMKRWKCPTCGRFFIKSEPFCCKCGEPLEKGE